MAWVSYTYCSDLYGCINFKHNSHNFDFRITQSKDPAAFHGLFQYLEDKTIIADKAGMWQCIAAVADKAFKIFLGALSDMVQSFLSSLISYLVFPKENITP